MQKFTFVLIFVVTVICAGNCEATDVWVAHWQEENFDIYAMDDTIRSASSHNGKYFTVSAKIVMDGQLQRVVKWKFSKWHSDMWRYETDTMDGSHTTIVIPRNELFEFCMNKIGWFYKAVDMGYY